jgi:hypothetical protein
MSAKLACSVLPTMEICPNCKSEMTIKEVTPICADGFEDVTHRCKSCRSEMKRTFNDVRAWEPVTLASFSHFDRSQAKPGLGLRRNAWEQNKDQGYGDRRHDIRNHHD